MAQIKVDLNELLHAAKVIDDYIFSVNSKMNSMDEETHGLSQFWEGDDYNQYVELWNSFTDSNSTQGRMVKSLGEYSSSLKQACSEYTNAAEAAANRANNMCR